MHQSSLVKAAKSAGKASLFFACLACGDGEAAIAKNLDDGAGEKASSTSSPLSPGLKEALYLEVYINDVATHSIANFRRYRDGCLTIEPSDLKEYKIIVPESATHASGGACLERMPGLTYKYDANAQKIYLNVPDALRETLQFSVIGKRANLSPSDPDNHFSAIFNYALTADFGSEDYNKDAVPAYQGVGALLDAHLFSDYGNFDQSGAIRSNADGLSNLARNEISPFLRLDTHWFANDDVTLKTYSAGDFISRSLGWTRSIRMAGVQITRDFALRPDLVTQAVPSFSGSAAVPSTVEVYANQNRAFSQQVSGGPFNISNLPIVSGPGTLKLVVRDSSGKETSTEYAYYASPLLLAQGFYDYSVEGGFARTFYGVESNSYDENPVGSASVRYGLQDRITLEAHAEGGAGLVNAGAGTAAGLSHYGVATASVSASDYSGKDGGQLSVSAETALWGARLYARSLRAFGDYEDLASVTFPKELHKGGGTKIASLTGATYRKQDQLSVSFPLNFDPGSLGLNYTDAEDAYRNKYKITSLSYSRPFLGDNSTIAVNAFNNLEEKNSWGVFATVSFSWDKYSAGSLASASADAYSVGGYVSRTLGQEPGSYGYNIRAQEGTLSNNSASVSYRAQAAQVDAGVLQIGKTTQATASVQGSVAFMQGVYFANRIDNSFGIVDTGIAGVTVLNENHPIGETDSAGRILIPNLRAREQNAISIDPASIPAQADIDGTNLTVVPKQRGGATIRFKGNAQPASALVVFKDEKSVPIPSSSEVWINGASDASVIGFDGEAYLTNLQPANTALVKRPDGSSCNASFDFILNKDAPTRIENVICSSAEISVASLSAKSAKTISESKR